MNATPPAPHVQAPPLPDGPTVSTQWLADHLGADRLVVLDASVLQIEGFDGRPAYLTGHDRYLIEGHVPGAAFADLLAVFSDPDGRHGFARPDARRFADAAASLGIDDDTTVVVYDSTIGTWAARLWWLFRAFGHEQVAVLDGGLIRWNAEERPLERGHREPEPSRGFTAREHPEAWADRDRVAGIAGGDESATLVCALPAKEYTGEKSHRARPGHIPGSLNVPAHRLLDRETNRLKPAAALREQFAAVLEREGPVVAYCAGGVASAADALALELLGRTDVAVYDGSLNEWSADPAAPLETGA